MDTSVAQQVHAYRNGHSLVASSIKLGRIDQDLVDRLSDLAGPIGPNETFKPYLTFYPLTGDHYVVARTWQDLAAPRAGCVITRSLLLSKEQWSNGNLLRAALNLLNDSGPSLVSNGDAKLEPDVGGLWTTLPVGATYELVEAFFLEQRQPIAVFEALDAETMAVRLLLGLWPALKSNVAVCTHAYSPRSIGGRPFDLLFSPASARSNYSAWSGRRIDGQSALRSPRHNWTPEIAKRVFEGPEVVPLTASLRGLDFPSENADEAQFRLSMLWEELRTRAADSPLAVLGMLDIVASLGHGGKSLAATLAPVVRHSIETASEFELNEFFNFIIALLRKFSSRLPPTSILNQIREAVSLATLKQPAIALDYIQSRSSEDKDIPTVIYSGLARGFSRAANLKEILGCFSGLNEGLLLRLVAYGPKFAGPYLLATEQMNGRAGLHRLYEDVKHSRGDLRRRARRNLIRHLATSDEAQLLKELVRGASNAELLHVAGVLSATGALRLDEFADELVSAADSYEYICKLRLVFAEFPDSSRADELVLKTLAFNERDIEWLLRTQPDSARLRTTMYAIMERATDNALSQITESLADDIYSIALFDSPEVAVSELARFLRLIPFSFESVLRTSAQYKNELLNIADREFFEFVISGIFCRCDNVSSSLPVLEAFVFKLSSYNVSSLAASPNISTEQLARNILLIGQLDDECRTYIASSIDVFTGLIVRRRGTIPATGSIEAWSDLIHLALSAGHRSEALRAASSALDFSLSATDVHVSALVKVAFPMVYERLRSEDATPSFFSFFTFHDWDRCKTARNDLVRAFARSVWPPAHLLEIAFSVNEVESFLSIFSRTSEGGMLLSTGLADITLPDEVRSGFLRFLRRY